VAITPGRVIGASVDMFVALDVAVSHRIRPLACIDSLSGQSLVSCHVPDDRAGPIRETPRGIGKSQSTDAILARHGDTARATVARVADAVALACRSLAASPAVVALFPPHTLLAGRLASGSQTRLRERMGESRRAHDLAMRIEFGRTTVRQHLWPTETGRLPIHGIPPRDHEDWTICTGSLFAVGSDGTDPTSLFEQVGRCHRRACRTASHRGSLCGLYRIILRRKRMQKITLCAKFY
jgi:hypothetical protein